MTPEVQAKYDVTHRYWESIIRRPAKSVKAGLPEPLKFDTPEDVEPSLGNRPNLGDGIMNEHRAYFEARGGKRTLLEFSWVMSAGFAFMALFFMIFFSPGTFIYLPYWIWTTVLLVYTFAIRKITQQMSRRGCHVFNRDSGKLYLSVGDMKQHLELDFYEQYFYANSGMAGWNAYGTLSLKPRIRQPNGEFETLPAIRMASGGSKKDGLGAWYCLIRYMDKSKPFNKEEYAFFDFLKRRQQKLGFRIEGLTKADGKTEWL